MYKFVSSQVLQDAKSRLQSVILSRLEEAMQKNDHQTVLRFTRLYAPLGLQARLLATPC